MRSRPHGTPTDTRGADPPTGPAPKEARVEAAALAPEIRGRLLRAYDEGKRELPWREETDPYRIWVSEIMLQQTRVETVIPYYKSWLDRFPTLEALARAREEDVLRVWQGLGYYSRARNLHKGARVVRERFNGKVPPDPEDLRSLPGVGEYTAGALASIAFGQVVAAVDGNVRRVLSRLFDLPDPGQAELRSLAAELVDPVRPGDFNQALMELGALTCTPRSPDCDECPLRDFCAALAAGTAAQHPARRARKAVPEIDVAVLVAVDMVGAGTATGGRGDRRKRAPGPPDGVRFFLRRRPAEGLLARMWEFPGVEMDGGEAPGRGVGGRKKRRDGGGEGDHGRAADRTLHSVAARLARELGLVTEPGRDAFQGGMPLSVIPHAFTHLKAIYRPLLVRGVSASEGTREDPDPEGEAGASRVRGTGGDGIEGKDRGAGWFTPAEVRELPLPVAQEKIFEEAMRILREAKA